MRKLIVIILMIGCTSSYARSDLDDYVTRDEFEDYKTSVELDISMNETRAEYERQQENYMRDNPYRGPMGTWK